MELDPKKIPIEIDHHTLKLIVGVIALTLAVGTSALAGSPLIESISESYHRGGPARDLFVGSLFAIAAFLLAYNGNSKAEMVLSKHAAVAALGVAMFPCHCGEHVELVPYVHWVSAAVMFGILAAFCVIFFLRARAKGHPQALARAGLYAVCGSAIVFVIVVLAADHFLGNIFSSRLPRLTYIGEALGLTAFGAAWMTASRTLPYITRGDEKYSILPFHGPPPAG